MLNNIVHFVGASAKHHSELKLYGKAKIQRLLEAEKLGMAVDSQNGPANIESNLGIRCDESLARKRAEALGEMGWEVKVGALHKVPMWDFVQAVVVATRVLEIRFGIWELRQVSGTSEVCLPSAWEKAWLPWC
ncbi:hypothetical protein L3X38_003952 [Prunus dulcis]|uniref:Uncharacterized protein n=1 Tax=Prunus dulcis TaxID=3755 RepID=A0AAD5F2M6_PRUDU|nr:hypothetical protein L3X38_003952 [Prunus dulcis]